jgi:hypothetical protein
MLAARYDGFDQVKQGSSARVGLRMLAHLMPPP